MSPGCRFVQRDSGSWRDDHQPPGRSADPAGFGSEAKLGEFSRFRAILSSCAANDHRRPIAARGVKAMDALHVTSAITAGANWLLTTDLGLIRRMHGDDRIVVADPIDFIRHWQGYSDKNGGATNGSTGLDHNFGQRRRVRIVDPTVRPRSVGSAVRTNDLAAGVVVGVMIKAVLTEAGLRLARAGLARCVCRRLGEHAPGARWPVKTILFHEYKLDAATRSACPAESGVRRLRLSRRCIARPGRIRSWR